MDTPEEKTIELGDGPARGRQVTVKSSDTQLTLQADPADRFSAWVVYRPTGERNPSGIEIWCEYLETDWHETLPADM